MVREIKAIWKRMSKIHVSSRLLLVLSIINILVVVIAVDYFSMRIKEIEVRYELSEGNINRVDYLENKIDQHDDLLKLENRRNSASL